MSSNKFPPTKHWRWTKARDERLDKKIKDNAHLVNETILSQLCEKAIEVETVVMSAHKKTGFPCRVFRDGLSELEQEGIVIFVGFDMVRLALPSVTK